MGINIPTGEGTILTAKRDRPRTYPDMSGVRRTQSDWAGTEPVRCGCRLGVVDGSTHWRNLANTTQLSVCGDDTALLWPPYVIGQVIILLPCGFYLLMVALCNRADHYIFILFLLLSSFFFLLLLFFFSSPNLSSRRLDVYHTSAHGVILV